MDRPGDIGIPDGGPECPDRADEALLVEGLRKGAEAAYEALIARYQQPVYSLVSRLLNDSGDASDVVQEVFLKIFRKVGAFRGESSLKTWIYRIAVNEAYNHQRWFSRHRRQEVGLEGDDGAGHSFSQRIADRGRTPFDYAVEQEQQAMIEAALARLNPSFRTAVVLRDVEELSYEEIAQVLQVALGTVKSRILRGREALRKELADRLEPEPSPVWTPEPAR
ncbi:MAG: sigma-70 family RNA polymerase sigma factor [Acidobacteriota bacterium]